jgi:hypothetical protein
LAALQIINDGISNDSVDKQSSDSKFSSFGPTSFSGVYNVKDYQIFNSTLGRLVPTYDKAMSNLLGSKPVDGLRLSQTTWSKSENLLRNSSQVLASAEHYLSATGALLQDLEGEGIAEIKSLLLQLDKALGTSQILVSGALANLTLSKRSEILDKSVSVNIRLNDGKRTIASSSSGYQPTPTFSAKRERLIVANSMPILLKHLMLRSLVLRVLRSLALCPRSLPPHTLSTAQEGRELPLPSIPVGGRLSQFSTQWEKRTSDPWVLSIIWGGRLELQFKQLPPLSESPIPFSVSSDPHKRLRLSEEVSVLLQKAAIEQVPTSSLGPGFYSHLLLVPKKKGGMRPVIDLSNLPCGPPFQNGDQQVH